jgi:alpha-D-ribose 1-methylphosphonate 5-triphosphate synthase subunit PhnG
MDEAVSPETSARANAMRLFAQSPWPVLDEATRDLDAGHYTVVRGPETGLVMLRGRMGATGSAFNLGEATVTRCTVRLASGTVGHSYVQGRNGPHALRAALCDALFQEQHNHLCSVLESLDGAIQASRQIAAAKAAATKVDFFTMVRGDG